MNIYHLFELAARRWPEQVAIVDGERTITYQELDTTIRQTAAQMKARGIRPGDRVLVFIPMGIDLYRTVLALYRIGAVAVFLDEWVSWKRMELCARLADCRGFTGIWTARILSCFSMPLWKIPVNINPSDYLKYTPDESAATQVAADQPALITFTTGSTGTPKAAVRNHAFLRKQFEVLREEMDVQPGDVDMTVLPIVLLINLGVGATSVIARFKAAKPDAFHPDQVVQQIQQHRVLRITASPFLVRRLAEHCLKHNTSLPSLKKVLTGGAPVFPAEARLFCQAFPKTDIRVAYGSTEAEPISVISASTLGAVKAGGLSGLPVGKVHHAAEVKIIPITDEPIVLPPEQALPECSPGEIGEIVVAGPHVLSAYWNNPEALRRNKIYESNGTVWHRTGDSGYLDHAGGLYLTGRCTSLFCHEGHLICPFLYENWLHEQPGVTLGTIVKRQEQVYMVVELNDPAQEPILRRAADQLPVSVLQWSVMKKIPRDPRHHSKIDYTALQP